MIDRPLLLRGDARALPLTDRSVDLVVTSPPYFGLRSYTDGGEHYETQIGSEATPAEYLEVLLECTREMVRVLKPSGSIWVNLGDKYATKASPAWVGSNDGHTSRARTPVRRNCAGAAGIREKSLLGIPWRYAIRCVDELELILRAEVVWSKPNGLPESVRDRVRRSHEQWFHFTTQGRYYAQVDEIREPHVRVWSGPNGGRKPAAARADHFNTGLVDGASAPHPLGALPGSVWSIPTQPLHVPEHLEVDHFAAFPMEWPRRLIKAWCPEDGTVLDPFGGTGTTALVASMLGRRGISVDASADYCRLAEWRCNDPKERARAAGLDADAVALIDRPHSDQGSLWDDLVGGAAS